MSGQIGEAFVRIRPDSSGFAAEASRQVSTAIGAIGSGLRSAGRDLVGFGTLGAIAIGGIGVAAIRASSEFSAAVSAVGAVSNASAADLDRLRESALQAGAATSFSASEAATAQGELARAGVSVADILGGGLNGALSLAAAGQLELGDAATIAAQAMNIFGLSGSDVTTIADTLAAGANKSAADVGSLGAALKQGGLAASQAGLNLQETVGTLSLFADNALVGSDAGTSFKTMLQRFVPQSADAARAMEELGLQFFDAQGEFVGIEAAAGQLQAAMSGLSDEQRSAALNTIFGADAFRAASILAEAGAAGVNEYTTAVSDAGAAARVAAQNLDNLKGDVEALRGSFETALIRTGDLFDPIARSGAQATTELINAFNEFAATPAFDQIGVRLGDLSQQFLSAFGGLSDTLSAALAGISVEDVNRVFDSIETGVSTARDALDGAGIALGVFGASLASTFLSGVPLIGAFVPAISPVVGAIGGLVLQSEEGRSALARLGERAVETGGRLGTEFLSALSAVADTLGASLGGTVETIGSALLDLADTVGPALADGFAQLAPALGDLLSALGELIAAGIEPLGTALGSVLPAAFAVITPLVSVLASAFSALAGAADVVIPALAAFAAVQLAPTILGWLTPIRDLTTAIGNIATTRGVSNIEALRGVLASTGTEARTAATSFLGTLNPALIGVGVVVGAGVALWQSYQNNVARVRDITTDLASALKETSSEFAKQSEERARQAFVDKDALDVQNRVGVSLADLVNITALYGDSVRGLGEAWRAAVTQAEGFAAILERKDAPQQVRDLAAAVQSLYEAGELDAGEVTRFFAALDELAQGTAGSLEAARTEFTSIAQEAAAAGKITQQELSGVLDAIANAKTPEELNAAFQQLSDLIGETGTSAEESAAQIRGLADALAELQGGQLAVDQAQGRFLQSQRDLVAAIAENGRTIDLNTDAGKRNRDALDATVASAKALAEAQAGIDASGQTSAATLNNVAGTLVNLRDQGVITEAQYQQLLTTYGLTPELIQTQVLALTADAQAKVADINRRISEIKGVPAPALANIKALVEKGDIAEAERQLRELERTRTANLIVRVQQQIAANSSGVPFNIASIELAQNRDLNGNGRIGSAIGRILDFYAAGGIAERHIAQIAPAGSWRVWAEPETGGEAYIPLSAEPWRRKRSESILREVARRFGMNVYASGGMADNVRVTGPTGGGGITFAGPVTFGSDARTAVEELDWYARYRLRAR